MKNNINRNEIFNHDDRYEKNSEDTEMSENTELRLPEILFITSYPPRECGIATYSQDLVKALNNKFDNSFKIQICPLESDNERHVYLENTKYFLNVDLPNSFVWLAESINTDANLHMVVVQHEFGFFAEKELEFLGFLQELSKPVILVFHTVLPNPDAALKKRVQNMISNSSSVVVMTNSSASILEKEYLISMEKITVIPHGTHLVSHVEKGILKRKYGLSGRKVLSTFGLLSSGKSIETTLDALPKIVELYPETLFLIIGKTHPTIVKNEGELYRTFLENKVAALKIEKNVRFINQFLPLPDLLEYLQLSDIYLFTSKNPNQAVSGTFSYAISCGCPIISTPIPHAIEVLEEDTGIIIDFENSGQLANAVISLLNDSQLRQNISSNGLHKMASTAWENSAVSHALLFEKVANEKLKLHYHLPAINLNHVKKMTTNFAMIQFSKINHPDLDSGYTLDDNARALVAMCQHFELTGNDEDLKYITLYFKFIQFCLQPDGKFLNYVDYQKNFTTQNYETNLEDSNGRAIWALGFLVSISDLLPTRLSIEAYGTLHHALQNIDKIHSTRSMAFIIKGLYYANLKKKNPEQVAIIRQLANRLVQMYRHEADGKWNWFESYLTYANSTLPEALLCAWLATGDLVYKFIAKSSFDFLLSKVFENGQIRVISNQRWLKKGETINYVETGGEQPIDVAYTVMALEKFYEVFPDINYKLKIETAFDWFLGNNHLNQIIYNPKTGGCYDGLEKWNVNLNQGAESTVSYLMARLTLEKMLTDNELADNNQLIFSLEAS